MPDERRTFLAVFAALLAVYLITLAPDVTLWDSGEFNAAIAALGIPHPPGTPLYILVARVWSDVLGFLPQALAVNALSAVATAAGCALLARLVARWMGSGAAGLAAGVGAGGMLAVWQNATETEVYALAFLLGVVMIGLGERAGRSGALRDRVLLAYVMALSVPLQISALVAAPAAVLLAASRVEGSGVAPPPSRSVALSLSGAMLIVAGLGLVRLPIVLAGVALLVAGSAVGDRADTPEPRATRLAGPFATAAVVVFAASATLFMLVRAAHDPAVNQGNPETWQWFTDVVARRQYDVPGLWPRRAPFWLQLANLLQYLDWQVAFGLDDGVAASWRRTPFTLLFAALAFSGARAHWRRDPRTARAVALLLAAASLGVLLVLNLRAGPSIGHGVLPADALHEARERDYFFALAFATGAAWAGLGAVTIARRLWHRPAWGLALAALPLALNWSHANRRRQPDASLARALGEALLESAPPNAILVLAGDNDTYAVWYQQQVHRRRLDVTPITEPLLGAHWYRRELARRGGLIDPGSVERWRGEAESLRRVARLAEQRGRPVAVSVALDREIRQQIRPFWELQGVVFVSRAGERIGRPASWTHADGIDTAHTRAVRDRIAGLLPVTRPARDGTARYVQRLLACPHEALDALDARSDGAGDLLDSRCNLK
ncbi:MAG TPA: DUF2723 domain-containing protein [Gemmatimonadaceae bacterium]|nr:DUF2723 domain-containing protein [Gemmatimonadaceae bacterium]